MEDSIPPNNTPLKRCFTCPEGEQWHPATSEFFQRNKAMKDGLQTQCRMCKNKRTPKVREYQKQWRKVISQAARDVAEKAVGRFF